MRAAAIFAFVLLVLCSASLAVAGDSPRLGTSKQTSPFAYISVSKTLIQSNEWVTVKFGNVNDEDREGCFFGVFMASTTNITGNPRRDFPATEPYLNPAPVKYMSCSEADPNFMTHGQGKKLIRLLDMREPLRLWLFFGGTKAAQPWPVSASERINFLNSGGPMQVHIMRTANPSEMRVMWTSSTPNIQYLCFNSAPATTVEKLCAANKIKAESDTYTAQDMCGTIAASNGWKDPGYFHTALITGLSEGETIYYGVSTATRPSPVFQFAAPITPGPHKPSNLLITGDMGVSEEDGMHYHWEEPDAYRTIGHLARLSRDHDMIFHIGDISYATGYLSKWDTFMHSIEGIASKIPYMVVEGNHERDFPGFGSFFNHDDSGGECGIPTEKRFIMPTPSKRQADGYYAFDHGSVHYIILNTELEIGPGSLQYLFLECDLMTIDRTITPWVVVSGHRPMYTGSNRVEVIAQIEQILMEAQVDVLLWAHVHYASVSCPLFNSTCVTAPSPGAYDAPVHILAGNGGQGLTPWPQPQPEIIKWRSAEWGFNRLAVADATTLRFELMSNANPDVPHYTETIKRTFPRAFNNINYFQSRYSSTCDHH